MRDAVDIVAEKGTVGARVLRTAEVGTVPCSAAAARSFSSLSCDICRFQWEASCCLACQRNAKDDYQTVTHPNAVRRDPTHIEGDIEAKHVFLQFGSTLLELSNFDCEHRDAASALIIELQAKSPVRAM